MSWYNETDNNFIDATQEFTGGTGGGGGTITIINQGDTTTINNTTGGLQDLIQQVNTDTFIKNINTDGRIYFYTLATDEQLKTRINSDGVLQYHHEYSLLTPQKLSGWYDVGSAIAGLETGAILTGVAVATIQGEVTLILADLTALNGDYFAFKTITTANFIELYNLAHTLWASKGLASWKKEPYTKQAFDELWKNLGGIIDRTTNLGGSAALPQVLKLQGSKLAFLTTFINRVNNALVYAGIGAGLYQIYQLLDEESEKAIQEDLLTLQQARIGVSENIAGGDTSAQDTIHIYEDYLVIDQSTNNGFTTAGIYEEISIQNGAVLAIEIKDVAGTLRAELISIMDIGAGFSVNDEIFINKSNIGGTTGQLRIVVSQLTSYEYILQQNELKLYLRLQDVKDRKRRRQFIPDKSDFQNGFIVNEINVNEDSGETTKRLSIQLRLDDTQFTYNGAGQLQLIDYDKISEIGDNTAGLETGLYNLIKQNENAINNINNQFGTPATYDQETGDVITPNTGVYINIDNVYEIIMTDQQTFQNNLDYKLNLGYKSIWRDYHYDLITIALKQAPAGRTFGGSDYNNDYLGYYPSLVRLSDDSELVVVQDIGLRLLTNLSLERGYIFFQNINPVKDYDLNRKFEFVTFLRPTDINNLDVEYEVLQTGIYLGFEGGQNIYDYDGEKLKVYIKNNKLNVSHYIRKNTYYYQSQTTDIFLLYLLATFGSQGALTTLPITGYKDLHQTINGNTFFYGLRNTQTGLSLPTDQVWYDIIRGNGLNANSFYYWYFYLPKTTSTTLWESPIIFYEETAKPTTRKNLSKVVIKYDYEKYASSTGLWGAVTFPSVLDIENNLEFRMRLETKKYSEPLTFHGAILIDFNQITKTSGTQYYTQELFLYNTSPVLTDELYDSLDLYLVHKGSPFQALPTGNTGFYNGQHRIKIYAIDVMEYDSTPTILAPTWELYNVEDTADFFETPIDGTKWNKLSLELDLPNKSINYYVNEVAHSITIPDEFSIAGSAFTNEDPYITNHPQIWTYANNNDSGLIRDNDIIIIGNQPSDGEINYTHFAWKHFQDPNDNFMTQEQRDKLDFLINYRYYYESVVIDRYLKCKEAYIDVLDCRKVLINGGFTFDEMIPSDQLVLLRSSDQSTDNVNVGTAFVSIDKLYNPNPTITGFLAYNHTTKEFYITSTSVNQADIDTGVNNLIKTTPSTYGLIFNDTDPADKFLEIDSAFINTLINLVIQNELNITQPFFDAVYNDVLVQVKDGSIYSPFNLRELPDTTILYNYVINGNHQYLYREINQLAQYEPTLGSAYGDLNPVVSYDFIGQIINNAPDAYGLIASDYDLEKVTPAGQVVYGVAFQNMKGKSGLAGGTTELLSANNHIFSDSSSGCISFFHKPYNSNTASDNHTIFKIQNSNGDYIVEFKLEYISNVATYKLILTDPNNNANILTTTFNNSDNEIYFGNENNILLWYEYSNYSWYINGKYHGSIINGFNLGYFTGKIRFDLSIYNNKCIVGEVKVYPRLLFRTGGTAQDLDFNYKRVGEISEMYRIEQIGTNGGFIIKELSGIQETKVRSIETRRRVQVLEEQGTGTSYTDADVRNVLALSAGTNINWNGVSFQFDLDSSISTAITNNTNNILSNTTDITNLTTALNSLVFYTDADVRNVLSNSAGTNLVWNATNNQFDLASSLTIGSGFSYNNGTGTLSVLKFSGNGSSLTQLNAGNISSGTLSVTRGGTGRTSFPAVGGILIGNVSGNPYEISQVSNLVYENSTGTLIVKKIRFPDQTEFSTANFVSTIAINTNNIIVLQNNLGNLQTDLTTTQTNLTTAQTDITNLQSQQSINTTNISNNTNGVFVLTQRVNGNDADILQNANDIAILKGVFTPPGGTFSTTNNTLTQLQTSVSANTTAIGNNSVKIADNEADIATANTNIATNTTAIATNTTNIATNTADIATNTTNIATNTTNIATNTTNIATNTTDIATANANIATNTTNIATNTTNIATNTADILTNLSQITTLQNFSSILSNSLNIAKNDIDNNEVAIATLQTDLSTAQTDIINNTTAIATNTSAIATANTNIATNTADIATANTNIATNTSAIATNTTNIATNTANIATLTANAFEIGDIENIPSLYTGDVNALSDGYLRIAKNNGSGGIRSMRIHYNDAFDMCWSDYGNTTINERTILRIAYSAPTDSMYVNSTGELEILNRVIVGKGTSSPAPQIFLNGSNGQSYSSQIVFGDAGTNAGTGSYKQGMAIVYDSLSNILRIGGDNNVDSVIDSPEYLNISRGTGYVGVSVRAPTERLDVLGNIKLSGSIFFDDGSAFSAGLYLYKTIYDSTITSINLASPTGWRIPTNQFTNNGAIYSVGATWNIGTNGIIIPKTGFYEITINHYFNVAGTDRASMISAISINGVQTTEYICGSYVRFTGSDRGSRGNNGVIIQSLTAGDQVASAWYETGDSSDVNLANASTLTIKRIG